MEASDIRRIGGGSSSGLSELGRYRTYVLFHLLVSIGPADTSACRNRCSFCNNAAFSATADTPNPP